MTTARECMTADPRIVSTDDTAKDIAQLLASEDIGAVVVCNSEQRLQGVITDRDLAVGVLGAGKDASTRAADLIDGTEVVTIGADDSIEEAVETMKKHAVRRLPVIDGTDVVGFLSQADVAQVLDGDQLKDLVSTVSAAGDNTLRG